jgi:Reverse transcriptase (RNA-dependent DNA polymerase)
MRRGTSPSIMARLVAKGFSQQFGFDYDETYAPVVHIEHVRILFALAALFNFPIIHLDAKNSFLNGKSDFAIYIRQPEGFTDLQFPDYVLLLLKSLYSLKQASRIWYLTLYEAIIDLGFTPSEFDPCIFISIERNMIIAIYVDDILAIGPQ